ncbi:MAG: LppX_LprAFG lipoprotein [Anaerolineaceae bacterium]|nr:MAG: LppX_LprAFG lipoprotein [Anaerolineaceae bacterium]
MCETRFIKRLISFVLIALMMVGCGGAVVEPTVTPTIPPPPTSTITPSPTPTIPPSPTPTIMPSVTPTIPPSPETLSPEAILEVAVTAMEELESFHFEMIIDMTVVSEGITIETPITFTGDFQAPDRLQGELTMQMLGLTIESEVIIIGEDVYIKDPESGEWEMTTEPATPFTPKELIGLKKSDIANMVDLTLIGEIVLDNVPVYHLETMLPPETMEVLLGEAGGTGKIVYWIGAEDGWIRQVNVEMEVIQAGDEATEIHATIILKISEFNKQITIEAP